MSTMPTVKVPSHCMLQTRSHNRLASVLVKYPSHLGSMERVSRTFGLKSTPLFRATVTASYKIKLISPDGKENEFEAPDDSNILDSAECAGIELPYSELARLNCILCFPTFCTRNV